MKINSNTLSNPLRGLLLMGMVAMLMASACHRAQKMNHKSNPNTMDQRNMTPFDDQKWTEGPLVTESPKLLKALESSGSGPNRKMWRLPVVIELEEEGLRNILSVTIGTEIPADAKSGIRLKLEDAALGVSLADRLHQHCPTGTECRLWVAGFWGSEVPGGFAAPAPGVHPFSLRAVLGKQDGDWASQDASTKAHFRDE